MSEDPTYEALFDDYHEWDDYQKTDIDEQELIDCSEQALTLLKEYNTPMISKPYPKDIVGKEIGDDKADFCQDPTVLAIGLVF